MTDEQLRALLAVVDARIDYHQACKRFNGALDTAKDLELSVRQIAASAGMEHTKLHRLYQRRRQPQAKEA